MVEDSKEFSQSALEDVRDSARSAPILNLASKGPIVTHASSSIKQACMKMVDYGIRRLPVVDPGTNRLVGILSARDLVDFFGGGEKYNIVKKDAHGNFSAAINLPVSKVMEEKVVSLKEDDEIKKAAEIMLRNDVGGCPVTDRKGKVTAIVSEGDFIRHLAEDLTGKKVEGIMTEGIITISPETDIGEAARIIVDKGFRRLFVTKGKELQGVLRTSSILKFFAKDEFTVFKEGNAEKVLKEEKAEDIMSSYFFTIRADEELDALIEMIVAHRMGGFPVEDETGLVGIVTEHDVFKAVYS
jgi:CBS domain-containing protein